MSCKIKQNKRLFLLVRLINYFLLIKKEKAFLIRNKQISLNCKKYELQLLKSLIIFPYYIFKNFIFTFIYIFTHF